MSTESGSGRAGRARAHRWACCSWSCSSTVWRCVCACSPPPLSFTSLSLSLSFSSSAKSIREFRSANCEFPGAKHRSGISKCEEHLGLLVNGLEMRLRLRLCCWLFLCPTLSVLEHACVRVCLCPTTPTPTQTQTHTDACRCRFVGVCVYSCPALCV